MPSHFRALEPTAPHNLDVWKQELRQSYTDVSQLLRDGLIPFSDAQKLEPLGKKFQIRITPYYAKLMSASPDCPIRKQALPGLGEEDPALPFCARQLSQEIYGRDTPWHADAIGDLERLAVPRLTHRYQNRAILHLSSLCAVYCRFCFRKAHLNEKEQSLYDGSLDPPFQYLQEHTEIRELILTGGDPLSVPDSSLQKLLKRISEELPQIRTVRFHSRMAVTLPSRFTPALLRLLGESRAYQISLVSHFNHPRELTLAAKQALAELKGQGVMLLNQSVLLKGVNTSAECLATLFQDLYETGVLPYYLHHPDWTPGTFYFRVSIERGRELVSQLRGLLSGPALPDYVLDIPQGHGKISLMDGRVTKLRDLASESSVEAGSSQQNPQESKVKGALYEVLAPSTRKDSQSQPHLYLDLFE